MSITVITSHDQLDPSNCLSKEWEEVTLKLARARHELRLSELKAEAYGKELEESRDTIQTLESRLKTNSVAYAAAKDKDLSSIAKALGVTDPNCVPLILDNIQHLKDVLNVVCKILNCDKDNAAFAAKCIAHDYSNIAAALGNPQDGCVNAIKSLKRFLGSAQAEVSKLQNQVWEMSNVTNNTVPDALKAANEAASRIEKDYKESQARVAVLEKQVKAQGNNIQSIASEFGIDTDQVVEGTTLDAVKSLKQHRDELVLRIRAIGKEVGVDTESSVEGTTLKAVQQLKYKLSVSDDALTNLRGTLQSIRDELGIAAINPPEGTTLEAVKRLKAKLAATGALVYAKDKDYGRAVREIAKAVGIDTELVGAVVVAAKELKDENATRKDSNAALRSKIAAFAAKNAVLAAENAVLAAEKAALKKRTDTLDFRAELTIRGLQEENKRLQEQYDYANEGWGQICYTLGIPPDAELNVVINAIDLWKWRVSSVTIQFHDEQKKLNRIITHKENAK